MAGAAATRVLAVAFAVAIAAGNASSAADPPSERVVDATTVATLRPIGSLSADGGRIAFAPGSTRTDCAHVTIWTPATRELDRWSPRAPCSSRRLGADGIGGIALAGTRAAWVELDVATGCTNSCTSGVATAVVGEPESQRLNQDPGDPGMARRDYSLRGDGDLLVFNEVGSLLTQIGAGSERCPLFDPGSSITPPDMCRTIRRGKHACCADSVSGGRIAIRERDSVTVLDANGRLVRLFPFAADAARLDRTRLVTVHGRVLETYDVATGARRSSGVLPSGYRLLDADGGIALLQGRDGTIVVRRLADGRSFTLSPGRAPRRADLEAPGLYYSYATPAGEGRLVLLPRAQVQRRLDRGSG